MAPGAHFLTAHGACGSMPYSYFIGSKGLPATLTT